MIWMLLFVVIVSPSYAICTDKMELAEKLQKEQNAMIRLAKISKTLIDPFHHPQYGYEVQVDSLTSWKLQYYNILYHKLYFCVYIFNCFNLFPLWFYFLFISNLQLKYIMSIGALSGGTAGALQCKGVENVPLQTRYTLTKA